MADIANSILYGVSESAKPNGRYKLLRITDIQENKVDWDSVPFTIYDEEDARKYLLNDGDILFARTGATVGKSYLVSDITYDSIYASYLIRIQTSKIVSPEYVKRFFESGYYWEQISSSSVGVGQPNVNGTSLGNLLIPIPPFDEQKRIVLESEKWFTLIESIDKESDCLSKNIERAKSLILNLAITGKLVPQDPSDEPAIELLKRINPDFKPCDNSHYPFEIPENWELCHLGELFNHNTGKALNASNKNGVLMRYITTSNLYWDRFELSEVREMLFIESEIDKCQVVKGDLLVCEGGDVGRSAIWPYDDNIMIQNHIHKLRPKDVINVRFYLYVLMVYKQIGLIGGKGIGILGLSSRELDKLIIPVPPIEEQHRITEYVDELFSKISYIIGNIN